MHADALRSFPSTWAKRLAFGRDPCAMTLNGYIKYMINPKLNLDADKR
jgi:hypothetical protein